MKTTPCLLTAALLLCCAAALTAQPLPGRVRRDDPGYRLARESAQARASQPGSARKVTENGIFALNQGYTSGCGGFSIAACAGIRFMIYCNGRYEKRDPMPEFSGLYLCCKADQTLPDTGYSMQQLLQVLVRYGIPLASDFPNNPYGCPFDITPHTDSLAALYRLWNYARIFDLAADVCPKPQDSTCLRRHEQKIYERTVGAIDAGQPVILVMALPPGFNALRPGNCTLSRLPDAASAEPPFYHAVVVTGYDDRDSTFQILNSYGKDWGCEGFARIKYEVFKKTARYGYVLEWKLGPEQEVPCGRR